VTLPTLYRERSFDMVVRDRSRFAVGAVERLAPAVAEIGGSTAFIVTDPGVVASGVCGRVVDLLRAAGLAVHVFDGVEANPGTATIEAGSGRLRTMDLTETVVIGLGGGSAIDSAKVIALHAPNQRAAISLGYHDETLEPGVPVIAIPTTAGTGAETNTYGVITEESAGRKRYLGHESVLPKLAILDPQLTLGLPPASTAATGIDAMTHSVESLVSANPNPFAEAVALGVIRTVGEWLPKAVQDGGDLEARSRMLLASHIAGVGQQSGTGVGAVHAIGHALGTRGRLAHGTALAMVMPEVLETYLGVRDRELALVGIALGVAGPGDREETAARAAIDAVEALLLRVDQRPTLLDVGIGTDIEVQIVADAVDDEAILNSPRIPSTDEIAGILVSIRG
jgi:alcohol dehydrogenase